MGSTTWGDVEVQEDPPVRLTMSAVSASFFDTLGAQVLLGRTFLPQEDGAEAPRVMVLSHAAWRQYFDMDPGVVGATVAVGARREPWVSPECAGEPQFCPQILRKTPISPPPANNPSVLR